MKGTLGSVRRVTAVLAALAALAFGQGTADDATARLDELRRLTELELSQRIVERFGPAERHADLTTSGEALALIARARFDVGDEAGALALLENAAVAPAEEPWIAVELARLFLATDRLDRALALLTVERDGRRQPRFPGDAHAWLALARIQVRRGVDAGVEESCRRFLELAPFDPGAPSAWHILAGAAVKRGDAQTARECFERAEASKRWHEVLRVRRRQVWEHPGDPLPRLGLALVWMEAGGFERARTILAALTESAPDFCRAHFHLGEAERALGDDDAARAAYDRALACDPEHGPARWNRALYRLAAGDTEGARADLEHLVAGPSGADPLFAEAHLRLARLLAAAGETQAARERYARYRELGGEAPLEAADGDGSD